MSKAADAYRANQRSGAPDMTQFMPLVRRIAGKLSSKLPPHVEIGDLVQAGCVGLVQAWGRFDQAGGASFETFASSRIRGAMLDWLRDEDLLPKAVRQESKRVDSALIALRNELGREPSELEIATKLGLSLDELQDSMSSAQTSRFLSFEDLGVESPESLFRADPGSDPFEQLVGSQLARDLERAIGSLPDKERLVLSLHHEEEMTFKEIALTLNLSEARICQLHNQALARLRSAAR